MTILDEYRAWRRGSNMAYDECFDDVDWLQRVLIPALEAEITELEDQAREEAENQEWLEQCSRS